MALIVQFAVGMVSSSPPIARRLMTFLLAYALGYACCFWAWRQFARGYPVSAWIVLLSGCTVTLACTWLFLLTVAPWTWDWWW
jgi:hypothetical protein